MAIDIKFDLIGNPEPPTIILANRNGNKLGQLKVDTNSIDLSDKFNEASEFSFILNKYVDGEIVNLWDSVVDFKLVYCKEWDMWFEISVELDEDTKTTKTVLCKQLGQAELSQIMLYDIEINTEKDIERDDYKITILWNEEDQEASMLHRLLKDKAPHYSIGHVDFTIANIQRSFSFDNISIYDAFQKIAEEIGCLFIFHSNSDENGRIRRVISVYDLEQNCMNIDCGYRGEFTDVCPKCGSTNIKYGYGNDTLIFVTSDELAANGIKFTTDVDSVKNCFKLEAGDDLMTATIRNCNPNGTDYIWYFSDDIKEDMSDELVEKIESYDELYKDYYNNYESNIDSNLLRSYNELVEKYSEYNEDLQPLASPIAGYSSLMNAYYNTVDLSLYLESGLMPSIEMAETNAEEQVELLESSFLPTVAVANINTVSLPTANSAVLAMAKIIVRSTFKVEIGTSELIDNADSTKTWRGNFIVTNYSDEEDTATSELISVGIDGDQEAYINQRIDRALSKEDTDDYSISGLFKKEYDDFCAELRKYALNPLISFHDAAQACIDILIEQGVGDDSSSSWDDPDNSLYNNLYTPYYEKLQAIEAEMQIRESEINLIKGVYNSNNELVSEGVSTYIISVKNEIQRLLDFEGYLGEELWAEFCSYRREDKYSNENYISDGLNNAELFEKALEFIGVAEKEIYKSSELQHSISTTLKNLLAIEKFRPLVDSFNVGNWIRVQVNNEIYKLRLLEYGISFSNLNNITVEFSDITKVKNGVTDVQDILSQASSMASSYSDTQRQANQGNNANGTIGQWLANGLNSALVRIQSNDNEEITLTRNGLLARSYNELTDDYSPEQLKLTHNIMAYTDDNWRSVKQAIGKHDYVTYNSPTDSWIQNTGYGMSAEFVTAGQIMGSKVVGGEIYSSNYHRGIIGSTTNKPVGTYINLTTGDFRFGGDKLIFDTTSDTLTLRDVTIQWDSTNTPEVTVNDISGLSDYLEMVDNLEDQLDGRAQTWYQDTDPSTEWITNDDKALHVGDLWHYTGETSEVNDIERIGNSEWVWQEVNGSYEWVSIEVSDDIFDKIDGRAQIFTSNPVPPYNVGDLWVQGLTGDIMHCIIPKTAGQSFSLSDWTKSSKYTDNSALNDFIFGEYAADLEAINGQVDKKAETWYQATDPSKEWTTDELKASHVGDLWFNTSKNKSYIYNSSYTWEEADGVPDDVYDAIDGKSTIYVTIPDNPSVGDLLIPTVDIDIYKAGKVYRYNGTSWVEISYTDDTRANAAYELADESKGIAENAKAIGETLVDGLGFQETEITGEYIISPVIAGGHLLIGDKTGTYAQITTEGQLVCTGANISGHINATSGSFTGHIEASSGSFTGTVNATSGSFTGTITATDGSFTGTVSSSTINSSDFIGGSIKSTNYQEDVIGTYINLNDGYFEVGGGSLSYADNTLSLGKMEEDSIINLCGGQGGISYFIDGTRGDTLKINSSNNMRIDAEDGIVNIVNNSTSGSSQWQNFIMLNNQAIVMTSRCVNTDVSANIQINTSSADTSDVLLKADAIRINGKTIRPVSDNFTSLGESGYVWSKVYAKIGTIQTSDEREKENIVPLGENLIMPLSLDNRMEQIDIHSELFDRLQPVQYNFINGDGRICYGLVAQQVASSMEEVGIGEDELDLVHHEYWIDENGEEKDSYGLSYTNLIAMLIHEVQKLKTKNDILEERISSLK